MIKTKKKNDDDDDEMQNWRWQRLVSLKTWTD